MDYQELKVVSMFGMKLKTSTKAVRGILLSFKAILLVLLLAAIGCGKNAQTPLPYYFTPDFMPHWKTDSDFQQLEQHTIAPFSFTNQEGNTVTEKDFEGSIYVANFFFTSCPSICPKMTDNLKKVEAAFAANDEVKFISHSVTPWIDSLPRLQNYATHYNLNANKWALVTGNKSEIYALARQSYFAEEEPGFNKDSTEFLHTEHFILVDKERKIRGIYNGTILLEAERMIEDIKLLIRAS